jgi:dTDP-glucose pyrophosphorylase
VAEDGQQVLSSGKKFFNIKFIVVLGDNITFSSNKVTMKASDSKTVSCKQLK